MKTIYTAGVDLFLVDGEIYITQPHDDGEEKTIYSTKKIHDCPLLDRNRFVKGEDFEELANEATKNIESPRFKKMALSSFKAGYKANKNEFTRDDMEKAFCAGADSMANPHSFKTSAEFISSLRPLSLPTSVTIENNEIIEVKWK